jgi:uncharacterized protein (TIGR00730 family)
MQFQTLREDQFLILGQLNEEYKMGMMALNSLGSHTVTFYGGSRVLPKTKTYDDIVTLASGFASHSWGIVTGGGPGVMSAALEGAKKENGKAIAFKIEIPLEPPFENPDIALTFKHFTARKYVLRQSDILIYAPGGIGTLDELMENLTLMITGKSPIKPIYLFDKEFWQGYLDWFKNMIFDRKLVDVNFLSLFKVVDTPKEVLKDIF